VMMNFGDWMVFPRVLYRDNIEDALPNRPADIENGDLTPGVRPRNLSDSPFAVLDNRKVRAAELFITYDPTGATPFYDWDNDTREDAGFAFNVGLNYSAFRSSTDAYEFFFEPTKENVPFSAGLPPEDTWEVSSRMVFNPRNDLRLVTNLVGGYLQSTGDPNGGTREFYEADAKVFFRKRHILYGYAKHNAFGPYDFHRQFNITFPYQYELDYQYLLDDVYDELRSSKIGIKGLLRGVNDESPTNEFGETGENEYLWQVSLYFIWTF